MTAAVSYFMVRPDGRQSWVYRFRLGNRQPDMGLGSFPDVGLATARELASAARAQRRAGINPIEARKAERAARARAAEGASDRTFKALAERCIAAREATWKNVDAPGAVEESADHLRLSAPRRPGRGDDRPRRRPRCAGAHLDASAGDCETSFAAGSRPCSITRAKGWAGPANPARWRDLRHDLPAPKKVRPVANQPALPWQQLPGFMPELRARDATAARALEFAI